MLVKIESDIYNNEQCFDLLDRLAYLFVFDEGRHFWYIENPEEVLNSEWLKGETRLKKRIEDLIEKIFMLGGYLTPQEKRSKNKISISLNNTSSFSLEVAFQKLSDPVYVIVENYRSDGAFLGAIIDAYKIQELKIAFEKEWVQLDHAGGRNEILPRINFLLARSPFIPRIFVLADSDSKMPSVVDSISQRIIELCEDKGVKYVILSKREIENYLPVEALSKIITDDNKKNIYEAYCALNDTQKDYYDLKNGFPNSAIQKGRIVGTQAALFSDIQGQQLRFLRRGFGSNNLYQLFDTQRDKITKATLANRCRNQPHELENVLKAILSLL